MKYRDNDQKRQLLKSLLSGDSAPMERYAKDQQKDIYSIIGFYEDNTTGVYLYNLHINYNNGTDEWTENTTEEELDKLTARTRSIHWAETNEVPFVLIFKSTGVKPYTSEKEIIDKFGLHEQT